MIRCALLQSALRAESFERVPLLSLAKAVDAEVTTSHALLFVPRGVRVSRGRLCKMANRKGDETMILKKGDSYSSGLRHVGWTRGDDSGHEGYDLWDYFSGDKYLGPDMHGIEPVFDDF